MGNVWYAYVTNPDTAPDYNKEPTFDPSFGFPNGRKERTIQATQEELEKANLPLEKRDYCVDFYLEYLRCRQKHYPRVKHACHHEQHEYQACEFDDYVLRMKEYEREKRLKERAKRIAARQAKEELEG